MGDVRTTTTATTPARSCRTPRRRRPVARGVAAPLAAGLGLVLALGACSQEPEEEDRPESVDVAEDVEGAEGVEVAEGIREEGVVAAEEDITGDIDDPADVDDDVDGLDAADEQIPADHLVGLEVTVVGDVVEVLEGDALRLDKDGVDPGVGTGTGLDEDLDPFDYYDYDYTDIDVLTARDEALGDADLAAEPVLVVDPTGADVEVGADLRVSGTIRLLDAATLTEAYGVDLQDPVYDESRRHLVIVADSVEPASQAPSGLPTSAAAGG